MKIACNPTTTASSPPAAFRTRPRSILSLAVAALVCVPAAVRSSEADRPEHIILITVDTLRVDRLGAYGYQPAKTPNFDALAENSIRFDHAYSHASKTVPSVATLVTGRLPAAHLLFNNLGRLPEDMPTLADRLQGAGFQTAGFIGNYALRPSRGFNRGFDLYTKEYRTKEKGRDHPENLAGPLTDEAIDWISKRDPDRPVFLWVHYQEPHGAYTPPDFVAPESDDRGTILPKNDTNSGKEGIPAYQWLGHGRLNEYQARYDGEIAEFDRHLGRLLAALSSSGILDGSLLILTSDHGESFGEEGIYCAHGEGLDEALIHVPLLVRVPGGGGQVRTDTVRLIDIARTILEETSVDAQGFGGDSLLVNHGDRPVVAQVNDGNRTWRSYREGLYEVRQVSGEPPVLMLRPGAFPKVGAAMREHLERRLREVAPLPKNFRQTNLSTEEHEALKALGYVD